MQMFRIRDHLKDRVKKLYRVRGKELVDIIKNLMYFMAARGSVYIEHQMRACMIQSFSDGVQCSPARKESKVAMT